MVQLDFSPSWCALARHFQPLLAVDLVIANDPPHAFVEDLCAAARQRIHAGVHQLQQRLANGELAPLRQIGDLHHGERLQMDFRETLLQAAQHLAVPIQRQLRMQAADDVELGDRFAPALARAMPHFFERPGVRLGILGALAEGAQLAAGHAHVGGIDVPVDVEPGDVAVLALAHQVGHVADGQNVGAAEEREAVVEIQALAGLHFFQNRLQAAVFNVDLHARQALRPKEYISAAQNRKNSTLT